MKTSILDSIHLVRMLKGAPLSILILLAWNHQPLSRRLVIEGCGYSDKTVDRGLSLLKQLGLAEQSGFDWRLADGVRFPLTSPPSGSAAAGRNFSPLNSNDDLKSSDSDSEDSILLTTGGKDNTPSGDSQDPSLDASHDPSLDASHDPSLDASLDPSLDASPDPGAARPSDPSSGKSGSIHEAPPAAKSPLTPEQVYANLEAMRKLGISRNRRTTALAKLPHVNPDYIRSHVAQAKSQPKSTVGLAIVRMEQGLPAPRLNGAGHLDGCRCEQCQRAKYRQDLRKFARSTTGEYEYVTDEYVDPGWTGDEDPDDPQSEGALQAHD